jgi:HEAT repeat protein
MCRSQRSWVLSAVVVALMPAFVQASRIDDLVAALAGNDEQARTLARQLLPREGAEAVPKLLPLLRQENPAVREAAFQVLADLANEASAPGRAADRSAVAASLMTLFQPDQPASAKLQGLRLIPIVIPADGDVGPVAALLSDPGIRERARESLEEMATTPSRTALREQLAKADPEFACALLNSLGRLHDRESLETIAAMTRSGNARVRAVAARALAWTGDPSHLKTIQSVAAAADPATRSDAIDALLRLLDQMGRQLPHQHAAMVGYLQLLPTTRGPEKDGALAGLGRVGDASCVPAVLAAIRDAEPPTLLVGMNSLRNLPGKDVTRALVEAYPGLPARAQVSLIPVLGSRRDPIVRPILQQAANSGRKESRLAAIEALKDGAEAPSDKTSAHPATDLHGLVGVVRRWWVVGPFDLGEKHEGWETTYIDEPRVNVVARYMAGKTRRQWKLVTSHDPQGKIDLRALLADRDNCIGYAYAEIELDKPTDALLLLGVDDSEKIWVNGKKVLDQFAARPLQVDQDRVPVHLEAGTNSILLKLYQNTQGWEFCVRIVTTDGRPAPFEQKSE